MKNLSFVFAFWLGPRIVSAQTPDFSEDPAKLSDLATVINSAVGLIMPIALLLTVAMGITGAVMWMMSGGNPEKLKMAQGTLTWAVIGFVFVALSWWVISELSGFIFSL